MDNHNQNINELLKRSLSEKKTTVPPMVWENIEANIVEEKKKRRFFIWFLFGTGVLLGGVMLWFGLQSISWTEHTHKERLVHESIEASPNSSSEVASKHSNFDNSGEQLSKNNHEKSEQTTVQNKISVQSNTESSLIRQNNATSSQQSKSSYANTTTNSSGKTEPASQNKQNSHDTKRQLNNASQDVPSNKSQKPAIKEDAKQQITPEGNNAVPNSISLPALELINVELNPIAQNYGLIPQKLNASEKKMSPWSVVFNLGYNAFDITALADDFRSGAISNRVFPSFGLNAKPQVQYHLNSKLKLRSKLDFGYKKSEFKYDILTDDQGYFIHEIQGNDLPLEEINDQDESCNCYVIKGSGAQYNISSLDWSLGFEAQIIKFKAFRVGIGADLGTQLWSKFKTNSSTVLDIEPSETSWLKTVNWSVDMPVSYPLGENLELLMTPSYREQLPQGGHYVYQKKLREFMWDFGVRLRL